MISGDTKRLDYSSYWLQSFFPKQAMENQMAKSSICTHTHICVFVGADISHVINKSYCILQGLGLRA